MRPTHEPILASDTASPQPSSPQFSGEPGLISIVEVRKRVDGLLRVIRRRAWIDGREPPSRDVWDVAGVEDAIRTLGPGRQTARVAAALRAAGL